MNGLKNNFGSFAKFACVAALVSLIGLGDSVYLTIHYLKGEMVPCSIVAGCETVLSSSYAAIAGIPLGIFGAVAYFVAFGLSVLTIFGNSKAWFLFGVETILMSLFTLWLLYLQGFVIGAFCQFCLLSAASTFALFIIAAASKFWRSRL
ncbi:MAG: vitamin K epoxide reductase family protein [Pyrinomonadaceae bacterium]